MDECVSSLLQFLQQILNGSVKEDVAVLITLEPFRFNEPFNKTILQNFQIDGPTATLNLHKSPFQVVLVANLGLSTIDSPLKFKSTINHIISKTPSQTVLIKMFLAPFRSRSHWNPHLLQENHFEEPRDSLITPHEPHVFEV